MFAVKHFNVFDYCESCMENECLFIEFHIYFGKKGNLVS